MFLEQTKSQQLRRGSQLTVFMVFAAFAGAASLILKPQRPPVKVTPAFYYWKTDYNGWQEADSIRALGASTVYLRTMDVDWNSVLGAHPVGRTHFYVSQRDSVDYIPVVYITNRTFLNLKKDQIPDLAVKVMRIMLRMELQLDRKCTSLQVDCDWTEKTRERYFAFLKEMKKLRPSYTLSATLRLFQFRYPNKTGVPPVDRVMLMLYNYDNPKDYKTNNTIFDRDEIEKYTKNAGTYPLQLDFAVPAFNWGVWYKNGSFAGLLNGFKKDEANALSFLTPAGNDVYKVTADTVYRSQYLRSGNEIKLENCDAKTLEEAKSIIKDIARDDKVIISVFDFDPAEMKSYKREDFEKVFADF